MSALRKSPLPQEWTGGQDRQICNKPPHLVVFELCVFKCESVSVCVCQETHCTVFCLCVLKSETARDKLYASLWDMYRLCVGICLFVQVIENQNMCTGAKVSVQPSVNMYAYLL